MKRYSINLKRVMMNICIVFIMLVIFNIVSNFAFGKKHIDTKSVTIANNDTLWSIANSICTEADENLNVQNVVIEIKNINNLKSSTIYSGQEINVPIYN